MRLCGLYTKNNESPLKCFKTGGGTINCLLQNENFRDWTRGG